MNGEGKITPSGIRKAEPFDYDYAVSLFNISAWKMSKMVYVVYCQHDSF